MPCVCARRRRVHGRLCGADVQAAARSLRRCAPSLGCLCGTCSVHLPYGTHSCTVMLRSAMLRCKCTFVHPISFVPFVVRHMSFRMVCCFVVLALYSAPGVDVASALHKCGLCNLRRRAAAHCRQPRDERQNLRVPGSRVPPVKSSRMRRCWLISEAASSALRSAACATRLGSARLGSARLACAVSVRNSVGYLSVARTAPARNCAWWCVL